MVRQCSFLFFLAVQCMFFLLLLMFGIILRRVSGGFPEGFPKGFPRGFRGFPRVSATSHTARTVGIAHFQTEKAGASCPLYNFRRENRVGEGSRILTAPLLLLEF